MMEEITIWIFRNNLFTNDFYTAKLGWDSSQFKLLTIGKVVCIIVIKIDYTDKLKVNQIKIQSIINDMLYNNHEIQFWS